MTRSPSIADSPEIEGSGSCEGLRDTSETSPGADVDRAPPGGGNTYVFPIRSVYQRELAREEAKHPHRPNPTATALTLGLTDAIFGAPSRPTGVQRSSSDSIHEAIHMMLEHRGDLAPNRTMSTMSFRAKSTSGRSSIPSPTSQASSLLPQASADSPPLQPESNRPSLTARPTAVRVPTVSSTDSGGTNSSNPLSSLSPSEGKDRRPSLSPMTSQEAPSDGRKESVTTATSSDLPETPATGSMAAATPPPPKPQWPSESGPTHPQAGSDPVRSPVTCLEENEEGVTSLVHDFMDIIRLDGAAHMPTPSSNDNATSGKSGRSTLHQPQPSAVSRIASTMIPNSSNLGPSIIRYDASTSGSTPSVSFNGTKAAQAQAMREQKEHSVRDFINDQARTVQISDPNEASPSTSPLPDSEVPSPERSSSSADEMLILAPKAERWDRESQMTQSAHYTPPGSGSDQRRSDKATSSESRTNTGTGSGTGSRGTATGTGTDSRLDSALATSSDSFEASEPAVTFRFQHVEREDGHHIVTGREGNLVRCEDEPITIPGAIQSFGVLIVLEWDYDTDKFIVRQVSEVSFRLENPRESGG